VFGSYRESDSSTLSICLDLTLSGGVTEKSGSDGSGVISRRCHLSRERDGSIEVESMPNADG